MYFLYTAIFLLYLSSIQPVAIDPTRGNPPLVSGKFPPLGHPKRYRKESPTWRLEQRLDSCKVWKNQPLKFNIKIPWK